MTPDELYENCQRLAIRTAQLIKDNPYEKICSSFWCALALLYEEMVNRKEITRLQDIGRDKAMLYWTQACVSNPKASKLKRIWIMRALYMYDLIAEKQMK